MDIWHGVCVLATDWRWLNSVCTKPKNPSLERVHARKKIPTGTKFTGRCLLPLKWLHRLLACGFGPHGGAAAAAPVAECCCPCCCFCHAIACAPAYRRHHVAAILRTAMLRVNGLYQECNKLGKSRPRPPQTSTSSSVMPPLLPLRHTCRLHHTYTTATYVCCCVRIAAVESSTPDS